MLWQIHVPHITFTRSFNATSLRFRRINETNKPRKRDRKGRKKKPKTRLKNCIHSTNFQMPSVSNTLHRFNLTFNCHIYKIRLPPPSLFFHGLPSTVCHLYGAAFFPFLCLSLSLFPFSVLPSPSYGGKWKRRQYSYPGQYAWAQKLSVTLQKPSICFVSTTMNKYETVCQHWNVFIGI